MSTGARAKWLLVITALLFSTGGAGIKACSFAPIQIACLRSGIAAVVLLLLLPSARRAWSVRVVLVGACYAATMILYVTANKLTTSAHVIFLQSTAPLYILLLGPVLLHEPITRTDILKMVVVATGIVLLVTGSQDVLDTAPDPARGNLVALLSGVSWALTIVGLRWLGRSTSGRQATSLAAVASGNLLTFVVCLPWALPLSATTFTDWATVSYLGVFQIGLAYVCLTGAVRHVTAWNVALILLIEPVVNPIWSWILHGEVPGVWAVAGGVLVLIASVLPTEKAPRRLATAPATGAARVSKRRD